LVFGPTSGRPSVLRFPEPAAFPFVRGTPVIPEVLLPRPEGLPVIAEGLPGIPEGLPEITELPALLPMPPEFLPEVIEGLV